MRVIIINLVFLQKEPENYEEVLASLALDIQKRQTRLSEIRLRERRATLFVTAYTFAAWVVYVGLWYTGLLPRLNDAGRWPNENTYERAMKAAPVIIGPLL